MGCTGSKRNGHHDRPSQHNTTRPPAEKSSSFFSIKDKYQTLEEVQQALRKAGLESSNLIIGIDYTKSNTWNGKNTFHNNSLHAISPTVMNPYQEAIQIIGKTLEPFDDDKLIPVFGFGDSRTTDKAVFPFFPDRVCYGFQEVLQAYTDITPLLIFSGPTSFAPLIREAINIVKTARAYHILVIIADGAVTNVRETQDAIVEASNYPLSIITIGVGDGPWELMEEFDDGLPERRFDNFQFVDFHKTITRAENREVDFAMAALQEIPDQFLLIQKLHLL
eukprot:Phypoly_transcript_11469.p1 GENE.Phypoly_transcript_11469~~Phypoly_transcript_11469.p1  ORF type:complete len:278 (+),score=55.59 Phypoly_transcript_11469:161-994(+)